jgi:hypothetical protein
MNSFNKYIDPESRREINAGHSERRDNWATERDFEESLRGYQERPAGPTFRKGDFAPIVAGLYENVAEKTRAKYEAVRLQAGKLNGRLAIWDPLKAERDRNRKGFTGRPGIIECPRDAALPELDEFMAKYQRALADNDGRVQFSIETRS